MEFGIAMFATDRAVRPDELAQEVEARRFASLSFPEHTHMPLDHSPYPSGGELPDHYRRTFDPFVALTAAAVATTTLRIGTGVCLVAQRDPFVLAKAVASLDVLSGGRMHFGVGFGWNRPEIEHHGVAFEDRRSVVRERVQAIKTLWTQEEAVFDGRHVQFTPTWAWPKPAQQPHPPILLGAAAGLRNYRDVAEFADIWAPIPGRGGRLEDAVPVMRRTVEESGRDPDTVRLWVMGAPLDPSALDTYSALGVEQCIFWIPSAPRDVALPYLDEVVALREQWS